MNKYQNALNELEELVHSELDGTKMLEEYLGYINTLQELINKCLKLENKNLILENDILKVHEHNRKVLDSNIRFLKKNQNLKEAIMILKTSLGLSIEKEGEGYDVVIEKKRILTKKEGELLKGVLENEN